MDHLLRAHAPIPSAAWTQIDDEARERLTPRLAARKFVDWVGPGGWGRSATNLGRTLALEGPPPGCDGDQVRVRQRQVLPLVELRVPFTVARVELDNAERGAVDLDFDDLDRAARVAAEIENRAIFHGWPAAGIEGLVGAAASGPALGEDPQGYPGSVARAVAGLRVSGIEGPYGLAIDPEGYTRIVESTEHGGYLLLDHLERILGGSVVWTPGVSGAVVLSQRGGDFLLDVGQDLSVGYSHHDAESVTLYLEESFSFRVVEPDAATALPT